MHVAGFCAFGNSIVFPKIKIFLLEVRGGLRSSPNLFTSVSVFERDANTWPIWSMANFSHFLEQNAEYILSTWLPELEASESSSAPSIWPPQPGVTKASSEVCPFTSFHPTSAAFDQTLISESQQQLCWVSCLCITPANQPSTPLDIVLKCQVQTPYHSLSPITMCSPSSMPLYMLHPPPSLPSFH